VYVLILLGRKIYNKTSALTIQQTMAMYDTPMMLRSMISTAELYNHFFITSHSHKNSKALVSFLRVAGDGI